MMTPLAALLAALTVVLPDNASAGWGKASATLLEHVAALDRPCTIYSTKPGTLPRDLNDVAEPLLVRPLATEWPPGVQAWAERNVFLRRYGAVRVEPRTALGTAQTGPLRRLHPFAATPPGCTLNSMLAAFGADAAPDSRRQVFQAGYSTSNRTLPEDVGACNSAEVSNDWSHAMEADLGPMLNWMGQNDGRLLSISESGAGLPRHSHGAAWLATIVGSKFWILHPPATEGESEEWARLPFSAAQWLERLGSSSRLTLPPDIHWCIQQPGEVMELPPFWHHATVNIGDVVAVGAQR